jgi:hypothetical protein
MPWQDDCHRTNGLATIVPDPYPPMLGEFVTAKYIAMPQLEQFRVVSRMSCPSPIRL